MQSCEIGGGGKRRGMWDVGGGIMLANAKHSWLHKPTVCAAGDPQRCCPSPFSVGSAGSDFSGSFSTCRSRSIPSRSSQAISAFTFLRGWQILPKVSRLFVGTVLAWLMQPSVTQRAIDTTARFTPTFQLPTPKLCVEIPDSIEVCMVLCIARWAPSRRATSLELDCSSLEAAAVARGRLMCQPVTSSLSPLTSDSQLDVPRCRRRLRKGCNQPPENESTKPTPAMARRKEVCKYHHRSGLVVAGSEVLVPVLTMTLG